MAKKLKDSALVVVDMLYDFIDGSMACQGADGAIEGTLQAIDQLTAGTEADETGVVSTYPILFIRDHHPADHCSFAAQGGPWPPHCVQGTHGADVHESLLPYVKEDLTFFKGEDPAKEQYSGFEGVNAAGQSLAEVLKLLDIKNVLVCEGGDFLVLSAFQVRLSHRVLVLVGAIGSVQFVHDVCVCRCRRGRYPQR